MVVDTFGWTSEVGLGKSELYRLGRMICEKLLDQVDPG
jgi:hypothetical protein